MDSDSGGWSPDRNGGWSPDRNGGWSPDRNGGWSPDRNRGWSPERNRGWSPDRDRYSPEWTRDERGHSPSRSPARDSHLIGMGKNPGSWFDEQEGTSGTSLEKSEQEQKDEREAFEALKAEALEQIQWLRMKDEEVRQHDGDGHQRPTDTTTENQVVKFEKEIMHEALEHGQFFTKDGDLIGDMIVGKIGSIDLSSYRDIAKDAIFTHNHPYNGQLSMEDLETAARFNMLEIRAITADGRTFSMARGDEGWKVTDIEKIKEIEREAKREQFHDPVAQKLYREGNENTVWKMLFEKIAEEIGGVYTVS